MYQKNLCSIHKRLLHITSFKSKSIYINCTNIPKPVGFSPYTEEALAVQLASILQACADPSVLLQGRQVHAQTIVNGICKNSVLGTKILGMYVLCGSFMDAKNMFYLLELWYAAPWNFMIRGFSMMGWFDFALLFYFKMLGYGTSPDKYTFPYVIKACGGLNNVNLGKLVHDTIQVMGFEMDVFVGSSLIKLYGENNCIDNARCLFDKMPQKDCVLWNVMLNGYVKNRDSDNAMGMFREMMNSETKPNSVTFACILSVCASEAMISFGTQLHGLLVRCGLEMVSPVANTLLAMYSKCQCLFDARKLFSTMSRTDLVTWNGMIAGYVQNGLMGEALYLFREMISAGLKPDSITFSSFLPSVSESASLKQCKEIQGYIIKHGVPLDVFLKCALIDIYFKCRNVAMALKIFNQSTALDVVVCTAMVSGFVLNGMNRDALEIFRWLLQEKMRPNSVTLASVLPACAGLAALKLGKELHGYILKHRHDRRCYVGSAITDMYAKCGRLDLAFEFFRRMNDKDAVSWNSMITSCSQNGKPEEAIDLFRQMAMRGTKYDCVSISAALSASANLSALHYGKEIHGFMMRGVWGYGLDGALCLHTLFVYMTKVKSKSVQFHMNAGVWGTYLGVALVHDNFVLVKWCIKENFDMDPHNAGYNVLPTDLLPKGLCY
ncbi:hypothetical protein L1049_009546 [Liquidambar formosana]|uniref:Pentatricopeptide repeat-containing protein n=1 Tax=Liquidambar formosana TaxID=63359 RepID=A0AAP0N7L4_LIQFO